MKKNRPETTVVPDKATCIFGAGVLLKHLEALEKETQGIQDEQDDIEFIHRARVASRRLRAAIPLFDGCFPEKKTSRWLKRMKKVTGSLGEARDTDVQLERLGSFYKKLPDKAYRAGVARLMLRLHQQREKMQKPVVKAMENLADSGIIEKMRAQLESILPAEADAAVYSPGLYQHSYQSIERRLDEFLAYDEIVNQPEKIEELHQMRIAAKWLRYTMENFAPLYANQLKPYLANVRNSQDLLGDIHDCDVWATFLPEFIQDERAKTMEYFGTESPMEALIPGILFFEYDRREARSALYYEFTRAWKDWQEEGTWLELRRTIQVPFMDVERFYPPLAVDTPQP